MNNVGRYLLYGFIAVFIALIAIQRPIMQGRILPALRPIMMFFFPPGDLYDPVLKAPLDVASTGLVVEAVFTNRYAGVHSFGVMAEKFDRNVGSLPHQFALDVRFFDGAEEIASITTQDSKFMFWTPQGNGVALFVFSIPEHVPNRKPVRCTVKVLAADPVFQQRHGPLSIYVQKDSHR